ncbi:hypothetical protein QKU48_gp0039 [Fadolivirus algeromassiliense]|jgi:hypothetical protein|uniref:Uncharacterized protein n=1 Tax=Fadolivirus FV1/VV64 TaxID=3070911 RepID=A0A7D3V8H2_9VIRU|nr:hypothetical protein QKU48_gp0039 [Fadolivirus algeromassiliense]QKF93497.1 hypothetical protein Fadolivirus_1_39 [Fadolivirus FV1/VV64]
MNKNYIIFGVIFAIILMLAYRSRIENFYYFMPPSNCMENVFGNMNCYPPYYLPFYTGDYSYPYPLFYF